MVFNYPIFAVLLYL